MNEQLHTKFTERSGKGRRCLDSLILRQTVAYQVQVHVAGDDRPWGMDMDKEEYNIYCELRVEVQWCGINEEPQETHLFRFFY